MATPMATVLPEAEFGCARIKHFTVDKQLAEHSLMRQMVTRGREPAVREGTYAQLYVNGSLVMSDTQMEQDSNRDLIWEARGDVLIAGLGLGMVILPLMAKKGIGKITVVEKHPDVVSLVLGPLAKVLGKNISRLEIVEEDIFTWTPPRGARYDTLYFDIWGDISRDNLKGIRALHKRYRHRRAKGGWMRSWLQDDLKYY